MITRRWCWPTAYRVVTTVLRWLTIKWRSPARDLRLCHPTQSTSPSILRLSGALLSHKLLVHVHAPSHMKSHGDLRCDQSRNPYGCWPIRPSSTTTCMKVAVKGLIAVHKELSILCRARAHKEHLGDSRMAKGMVFPL